MSITALTETRIILERSFPSVLGALRSGCFDLNEPSTLIKVIAGPLIAETLDGLVRTTLLDLDQVINLLVEGSKDTAVWIRSVDRSIPAALILDPKSERVFCNKIRHSILEPIQELIGTPFNNHEIERISQLTHDLTKDHFRDRTYARALQVIDAARFGPEGEEYPVPREDIDIFSEAITTRTPAHRRCSRQIATDALKSTFGFIASLARIDFPVPEFDIPRLGYLAIADSAFVDLRHGLLSGVEDCHL